MAGVSNKEIPNDFNIFNDIWTLYKRYYYPEDNEQYWNNVISDFKSLSKKYQTKLANDLCIAILNELDRKAKGGMVGDGKGIRIV